MSNHDISESIDEELINLSQVNLSDEKDDGILTKIHNKEKRRLLEHKLTHLFDKFESKLEKRIDRIDFCMCLTFALYTIGITIAIVVLKINFDNTTDHTIHTMREMIPFNQNINVIPSANQTTSMNITQMFNVSLVTSNVSVQDFGLSTSVLNVNISIGVNLEDGSTPSEQLEVSGTIKSNHLVGRGFIPNAKIGGNSIAGIDAKVYVSGSDMAFVVTLVTGNNLTVDGGVIFTVTFVNAYKNVPVVIFSPGNANLGNAIYSINSPYILTSTKNFVCALPPARALISKTVYIFNFVVIG